MGADSLVDNGYYGKVEWNMEFAYKDMMSVQYDRIKATYQGYKSTSIGGAKAANGPAVSTVANWEGAMVDPTWTFYTTDGTTAIAANKAIAG